MGASPREFLEPGADTLILSTTNGTQTILSAASRCDEVVLGSLLNLRAVAERARELDVDTAIFCAGFKGAFALDDAYCAGRIVALLGAERSDAAVAAELIAGSFGDAHEASPRPHVRPARPRGGHPVLLARERPAGRTALRADDRPRSGDRPVSYRFAFGRPPAVAAEGMVATSQPLATRAGLRALERGGNAADAALAAAAVLCVTEPMSTGIGGDCFAQVWRDGELEGLDSAGPAPASADAEPVAETGPRSVTVPGAVAGWAAFAERYCRLGLDGCLEDAIDAAEGGFARGSADGGLVVSIGGPLGDPPAVGDVVYQPELGVTLRRIADEGPSAFYTGEVAEAICEVSWLEEDDLAGFEPRWVEPLRLTYKGTEVCELPPPTQGVCALEGLGLLERSSPSLASQIRCVQLALEDALARVRDGADVGELITREYLDARRGRAAVTEPPGGTVYLCAVDGDRMAVSFIQSLFEGFGSGSSPRAPASSSRTAARASRSVERSSRAGGRTTRSSRGCSSATGSCWARSA